MIKDFNSAYLWHRVTKKCRRKRKGGKKKKKKGGSTPAPKPRPKPAPKPRPRSQTARSNFRRLELQRIAEKIKKYKDKGY